MTLVNRKLIKLHSESRSYALHLLNFKGCTVTNDSLPAKKETIPQESGKDKSLTTKVLQIDKPPHTSKSDKDFTFAYPTVGIPLPGQKYNKSKVAKKDLAKFDL